MINALIYNYLKGLDTKAIEKALEYIKTFPQGEASAVYVSYSLENTASKQLFAKFSFQECGTIEEANEILTKLLL